MIEYTSKINSNSYTFTINCKNYDTFLQIRDETIKVIDSIIKSKPKSSYLAEDVILTKNVITQNTISNANTSDFDTDTVKITSSDL